MLIQTLSNQIVSVNHRLPLFTTEVKNFLYVLSLLSVLHLLSV